MLQLTPDEDMRTSKPKNVWLVWANTQRQLEPTAWHLLRVLANIADDRGFTSAKLQDLAFACACSERMVQYSLQALKQRRLLLPTSQVKYLEGSTRKIPVYRLARQR